MKIAQLLTLCTGMFALLQSVSQSSMNNADAQEVTCLNYIYYHAVNYINRERSGSVVECLTPDQRATGSSLTGVTALWSLSKTHLS